jgi:Transposase DDE domain
VADATTDEVYAAMDWLVARQDSVERKLIRTHLSGAANPDRLALFDLSSSWAGGRHCPLAARGYSRDGKKGLPQIEYGLLTDPAGRPVAVRVFPGNTADPTAFTTIVQAVKDTFKLKDMVMVADRGMITSARVQELRDLGGFGWVTALRAPAIAALAGGSALRPVDLRVRNGPKPPAVTISLLFEPCPGCYSGLCSEHANFADLQGQGQAQRAGRRGSEHPRTGHDY